MFTKALFIGAERLEDLSDWSYANHILETIARYRELKIVLITSIFSVKDEPEVRPNCQESFYFSNDHNYVLLLNYCQTYEKLLLEP